MSLLDAELVFPLIQSSFFKVFGKHFLFPLSFSYIYIIYIYIYNIYIYIYIYTYIYIYIIYIYWDHQVLVTTSKVILYWLFPSLKRVNFKCCSSQISPFYGTNSKYTSSGKFTYFSYLCAPIYFALVTKDVYIRNQILLLGPMVKHLDNQGRKYTS